MLPIIDVVRTPPKSTNRPWNDRSPGTVGIPPRASRSGLFDQLHAEGPPVLLGGGLQVGHGDPDVVDLGQDRVQLEAHAGFRRRRPAVGGGCSRLIRSSASGM